MKSKYLPELLCPAGSAESFAAAIEGGADAIYLGGASFNARMNAKNLTADELSECVRLAHIYGVKVYLTLNTLLFDKEREGFLAFASYAADCGVDAFIVADIGAAALIHRHIPDMELHASTQMSLHNSLSPDILRELGFTRIVPARELSLSDITALVQNSPLETEIFIHGALCVSHSGQCLFSSMVGGRSGNRGECAQPCRLPYSCKDKCSRRGSARPDSFPLSLKDLSLARHVTELIDSGVHSLKIEGRMKSPEYVRGVTSIWRKLLDERRNATDSEMQQLSDIFSRGGFTDGYFTKNINSSMLGIRSDADICATQGTQGPTRSAARKVPLRMSVSLAKDKPAQLDITCRGVSIRTHGDTVMQAISSPIDTATVNRSMSKLGGTPFELESLDISLDDGIMLPVSSLNSLRRQGISLISDALSAKEPHVKASPAPLLPQAERTRCRIAFFEFPAQITPHAREYFDKILLPLSRYSPSADGFIMAPVIPESEISDISAQIELAISSGASCAAVGNIGNISLLRGKNIEIIGDYRFNVTNTATVAALEDIGVKLTLLSPELTLPQIRDIGGNTAVLIYGRIPLMTLEKCVIREISSCAECNKYMKCMSETASCAPIELVDRKGVHFPVIREQKHRNIIYNSLPTCMSDRTMELDRANISGRAFMFTTESPSEVDGVIKAYSNGTPLNIQVRRI